MRYSIFRDAAAREIWRRDDPWPTVCDMIANAPEIASKKEGWWLSLATYGDNASEAGCLRHAANLQTISGIAADYDGECVGVDQAAHIARAAGLRCVIYTSASHRPDAPRWRLLTPLVREHAPEAHAGLMDRLNGLFAGIFTEESWNVSQGFFIGRVTGTEYECRLIA